VVDSLHAHRRSSWGRRVGVALLFLVALALAGYVGSVVGPHFKPTSAPPTTSTSTRPPSSTASTVAHSNVKVLVANGTQEPNAASHFSQQLQQQGWNVAVPKNTTSAVSSTTIYYAPSQQKAAQLVAFELSEPITAVQSLGAGVPVASTTGLDVVVVIGPDLAGSGFPASVPTS
jgi:LytR cell envelope-related transcriptional attenuator